MIHTTVNVYTIPRVWQQNYPPLRVWVYSTVVKPSPLLLLLLPHSYVLSVLDKLVVDKYVIVYLHSGAPRHSMPSVAILHKFYKMVDRR